MSSFFRKPDDTETDESTYDDSIHADEGVTGIGIRTASESRRENATTKALRKVETLESTTSSDANALSRQLTVDDGVKQETKEWLMRALLEEKCLKDALADYEARNTTSKPYTKDHPDVRALADAKYEHMVDMLGRASILPNGPERRDSAGLAIKQQARAGLEYLSSTSPQPGRPGLVHRDTSLLSLHSSLRNAIITEPGTEPVSQVPFYRQEALNHSMDAVMGLPPVLRPLVDHPMFEMSRYLRDFTEVGMIGKGGYGRVYHVQHRLDGSNYAVKKINLNQHRLKRIQERGQAELDSLLNELRMLAKFDHPNIVRYYGGWLEYSTTTTPLHSSNGKLLLEAPPQQDNNNTSAGAQRNNPMGFEDSSSGFQYTESKRGSIDILFERSQGEILGDLDDMDEQDDLVAELQPQIRAVRKRTGSESTTVSGFSKLSSVHSIGPDDITDEVDIGARELQLMDTTGSASSTGLGSTDDPLPRRQNETETGSVLTLHIQMALHPLSLADYLSSDTANTRHCFHLKPALQLFLAILDGVQYLHDCGVVHRDLKPSNVFLTINTSRTPACIDLTRCKDCDSESRVKGFLSTCIGDFGLVTEIARGPSPSSENAEHNTTAPSKAVGTALYRPPTCATTASSEKLDVYALGIMLVELLIPFETKMERQTTLHDVRITKFEHAILVLKHGEEHGIALGTLIRDMVHSDEGRRATCEQVRSGVEAMLADSA